MSTNNDKSHILKELRDFLKLKSDAEFARFLGIKPQTLASWHSRNTFDFDLLYSKCVDINCEFLFTGKGSIRKKSNVPTEIQFSNSPEFEKIVESKNELILALKQNIEALELLVKSQAITLEVLNRENKENGFIQMAAWQPTPDSGNIDPESLKSTREKK